MVDRSLYRNPNCNLKLSITLQRPGTDDLARHLQIHPGLLTDSGTNRFFREEALRLDKMLPCFFRKKSVLEIRTNFRVLNRLRQIANMTFEFSQTRKGHKNCP